MRVSWAKLGRNSVSALAIAALAGCSTTVGQSASKAWDQFSTDFSALVDGVESEFFSDYLDKEDACYVQRSKMAEEGSFFDRDLVLATVGGAAAGGLIAALSGENVWAGIAIGAGVGLAGAYLSKLSQSNDGDASKVVSSVRKDVRSENAKIDKLIRSFDDVARCRKREAGRIQAEYNKGVLSRAQAEEQMADVRRAYAQDVDKFEELADRIADNTETYAAAYNEVAAANNKNELEVREYQPPQKRRRKSAVVKSSSPQAQAADKTGDLAVAGSKADVDRLRNDCQTNVQKRDDCLDRVETAEADEETMVLI